MGYNSTKANNIKKVILIRKPTGVGVVIQYNDDLHEMDDGYVFIPSEFQDKKHLLTLVDIVVHDLINIVTEASHAR